MPQSYALFDLDHTLLGHDCQALFANFVLRKQPQRRWKLLPFIASLPLRALKQIDTRELKARFHRYLGGMPQQELETLVTEFVSTEVLPRIYPKLQQEIQRHQAEGRATALVSASPAFYVKEIAKTLEFDEVIGTEFLLEDPFSHQPKIIGSNNKRAAKITALQKKGIIPTSWNLKKDGVLQNWWAYSDSDADLPMLEAVEHPICVHPKPALKQIAETRNWPIWNPPCEAGTNSSFTNILQALGLWNPSNPIEKSD